MSSFFSQLHSSLHNKRFRGVFCTAKKPIFVFLEAREMGRERKQGGGGDRRGGLLSPPPLPFYFALVPISADQTVKNATETLATQASYTGMLREKKICVFTTSTGVKPIPTCHRFDYSDFFFPSMSVSLTEENTTVIY